MQRGNGAWDKPTAASHDLGRLRTSRDCPSACLYYLSTSTSQSENTRLKFGPEEINASQTLWRCFKDLWRDGHAIRISEKVRLRGGHLTGKVTPRVKRKTFQLKNVPLHAIRDKSREVQDPVFSRCRWNVRDVKHRANGDEFAIRMLTCWFNHIVQKNVRSRSEIRWFDRHGKQRGCLSYCSCRRHVAILPDGTPADIMLNPLVCHAYEYRSGYGAPLWIVRNGIHRKYQSFDGLCSWRPGHC